MLYLHTLILLPPVTVLIRLLKLQTLDYESLLHYGQPGIASGVQEKKTSQFAESELIKKSLEGSRTSSSKHYTSGYFYHNLPRL